MVAEKLGNENGEAWYALVDLSYAYGELILDYLTARHGNFQIIEEGINRHV